MAVGITTDLNESRYTIISDSLMLLGVNEAGENIADADMQLGVRWLNRLVKQWESKGVFLNTNTYATLFLEPGLNEYIIGNEANSQAYWAETPATMALTTNAVVATTTLVVDSTLLLQVGYYLGVVNNDNILQWTEITSITDLTTLHVLDPLLIAANSGNLVYAFSSAPTFGAPLKVLDANIVSGSGTTTSEILMPILAFEDYFQLTNKLSPGNPVNLSYNKKIDTGVIRVWPTPNSAAQRIRLHIQRPIFNFDMTTDTQDLPAQYLSALVYGLSVLLAPSYGKSSLLQTLAPVYQTLLDEVTSFDQEDISCYLTPSTYRF